MTLKEAMKRIEALEQKVAELQVRPAQQIHYHYPQQPLYYPNFTPLPVSVPTVWMDGACSWKGDTITTSTAKIGNDIQWSKTCA